MVTSSICKESDRFEDGVRNLAELVASTMGPFGHNVIPCYLDPKAPSEVYRDGARVINLYFPEDPIARAGVRRLSDAALASWLKSGDGTSTTTQVLANTYLKAMELIGQYENPETAMQDGRIVRPVLRRRVVKYIDELFKGMITFLQEHSIRVQQPDGTINMDLLHKVIAISANNNQEIAAVITQLVAEVGGTGSIRVELSKSGNVETAVVPGYAFEGGAYTRDFMLQQARLDIENPYVVLVNDSVTTFEHLNTIIDAWDTHSYQKGENRALVLVCSDLAGSALTSALAAEAAVRDSNGRLQKTGLRLPIFAVRPPRGVDVDTFFEDMAAVCGTKIYGTKYGRKLEAIKGLSAYGSVERFTIMADRSTVQPVMPSFAAHQLAETILAFFAELPATDEKRQAAEERVNRLLGKSGIVRIPGATQGAVSWTKEVVEDAYMAGQAALRDGVLPGGGKALINAFVARHYGLSDIPFDSVEEDIAISAVRHGILSVSKAVWDNAGISPGHQYEMLSMLESAGEVDTYAITEDFAADLLDEYDNFGADPKNGSVKPLIGSPAYRKGFLSMDAYRPVNAIKAGVLDPTASVMAALENARTELSLWIQTKNFIF